MEAHSYRVNVAWNTDRKGIMCSPELKTGTPSNGCIEVATPPQFPKGMEGIWSPEHLFTASIASCFMTTFLAVAENSKLNFKSFDCKSIGKLEYSNGKPLMTEVYLEPTVILNDESDRDKALKVLNKSEANCLISNSVKCRITMNPVIREAANVQ